MTFTFPTPSSRTRQRLFAPLAVLLALTLVVAGCDSASAPGDALEAESDEAAEPQSVPGTSQADLTKNLVAPGDDDSEIIEGQYIVVFEEEAVQQQAKSSAPADLAAATVALTRAVTQRAQVSAERQYTTALRGFAGTLSGQAVSDLEKDDRVAYVEPDRRVHIVASQSGATWGLDRVDQRGNSYDQEYTYDATGSGVTAYILDTGINTSHSDFNGRASAGYDAFGGNGQDQNGHGTHVAGTVGSSTYGVAKQVSLVAVKVLNANGGGSISGVIGGVDFVANAAAQSSGPIVANMSLGGGASTALDNAVRNAVAQGATFVVAAGNDNTDACSGSPNRVDEALTVASTTSSDRRSSFSNYGSCVDLFAPGSNITSLWYSSNTATNTISGTSMASPHVAGAAALYLDDNPGAAPATVFSAIQNAATSGAVSNTAGSPNLLLYSLFGSNGGGGGDDGGNGDGGNGGGGAPCTNCTAFSGSLSGSGDYDYQPDGSYYYSGGGTQRGFLRGPSSADFDLVLYKYSSYYGWYEVASSTSPSSSEDIGYNGSGGYYLWQVESYSGSGSYNFYQGQ